MVDIKMHSLLVLERELSEKGSKASSTITDIDMDVGGEGEGHITDMDTEFESSSNGKFDEKEGLATFGRQITDGLHSRDDSWIKVNSDGDSDDDSITSIEDRPDFRLSDFDLITTLGTGTFARVWLVREKETEAETKPKLYALKVLKKADVIRLHQIEHIQNERMILAKCRKHPFIVKFVASWSDYGSLYMLMDYSPGGEIFSYLRRAGRFHPEVTRFYAAEITLVLIYLHSKGIVYRDLKPENILVDAEGHVQLVDFGFAKAIGPKETYTLCGTPDYLAPEVVLTRGHGKAVDWWALGVFIYECTCGFPPFYDQSPIRTYEKIMEAKIGFPSWVPEPIKSIVRGLCTKDLSSRLGNLSGGGKDVQKHPFFEGVDWNELKKRRRPGPIVPRLKSPDDTSYFDEYDPPDPNTSADDEYTLQMYDEYDEKFADF